MNYEKFYFAYDGPVMSFGKVRENRWTYYTKASTIAEALNNLSFNYKRINQLSKNFKIELDKKYLTVTGKEKK